MIRGPVGDARDADAVVRALRDHARHEGPVAVAVVREVVVAHEVVAAHEAAAVEVRGAQVAAVRRGPVGDAGVEHGHRHARRRPALPAAIALSQAAWTPIPNGPVKFHCSAAQPPVPARPGSLGVKAVARAT